jgi:hypothetical protein
MKFKLLNYDTIYSYKSNKKDQINSNGIRHDACFGNYFGKQHGSIIINFHIYIRKKANEQNNNFCFLDDFEIKYYLKYLSVIFGFYFEIIDNEKKDEPELIIKIVLRESSYFNKVALTWIRYLYEWPFNYVIKEALCLKKLNYLSKTSLITIIMFLITYTLTGRDVHSGQRATRLYKPINLRQFCGVLKTKCMHNEMTSVTGTFDSYILVSVNDEVETELLEIIDTQKSKFLFSNEEVIKRFEKLYRPLYEQYLTTLSNIEQI